MILACVLVALGIVAWLVRSYWAKQRDVAKSRHATLQALAQSPSVDREHIQALLDAELSESAKRTSVLGASPWYWKLAVIVAWMLMLVGMFMFLIQLWHHLNDGYWQNGIICIFLASAIFATPITFRELRRQGVL